MSEYRTPGGRRLSTEWLLPAGKVDEERPPTSQTILYDLVSALDALTHDQYGFVKHSRVAAIDVINIVRDFEEAHSQLILGRLKPIATALPSVETAATGEPNIKTEEEN